MKKFGLAVFALSMSIGLVSAISCNYVNLIGVQGSGNVQSEKRNISGFSKIDAGGAVNVEVTAQKDFDVVVEADDNLLQYIKTEVSGETLKIFSEGRISPKTKVNVKISMPELTDLDISGASNAVVANIRTDSLQLEASGASKIKIDGVVKSVQADASGASKIDAESLQAENADVDSSGASSVTVSPSNDLNADATGASSVYYTGEPKNVKQNSSGASSVKKK
ncbi:head GIN domain-containing protein [soil metagenome]